MNKQKQQIRSKKSAKTGLQQSKSLRNSKQGNRKMEVGVAMGTVTTIEKPNFSMRGNRGDGRITVSKRELLGEVLASVAFTTRKYSINPGLIGTFPWLASTCARGYESYLFQKLSFEFVSRESTTKRGSVHMSVDYDPSDPPPASREVLANADGAMTGNVWRSFTLHCSTANLHKFGIQKFIRQHQTGPNEDIKTYDVGSFYVGSYGHEYSGTSVGDVYVNYTIELMTPQYEAVDAVLDNSYYAIATGIQCNPETPFGGLTSIRGNLPVTLTVNSIYFQRPGKYLVRFETNTSTYVANSVLISGTADSDAPVAPTLWYHNNAGRGNLTFFVTISTADQYLELDLSQTLSDLGNLQIIIASYDFP